MTRDFPLSHISKLAPIIQTNQSIDFDPLWFLPQHCEVDVDLFAGGGGASTGMEQAFGKSPDIAINHDAEALAMHMANHPDTVHLRQNLISVHPLQATGGRLVRALWASPDCTHFSKAKGGKPRNQHIRDLAWVVVKWLGLTRPLVVGIENVEEFKTWGPLESDGFPIKSRAGETFRAWIRQIRKLGYSVSFKELVAADYGAPTNRKRLFIFCRLDKKTARWPAPQYGPGTPRPLRTAAECINWNDPAPSIFERKKPLAKNTQRRIAEGIRRYVLTAAKPFLIAYYGPKKPGEFRGNGVDATLRTQSTENRFGLVSPLLVKPNHTAEYYQCFRGQKANDPLGTITASPGFALCSPYLVHPNHQSDKFRGQSVEESVGTMTGKDSFCLTSPHLITIDHKGGENCFRAACRETTQPLNTITTENRHALVSACLVGQGDPSYSGKTTAGDKSIGTIVGKNPKTVAAAHLVKMRGTNIGGPVDSPLPTISAQGQHHGVVCASLIKYYSEGGQHAGVDEPLHTITAKARMGLSTVHLQQYNGASEAQPITDPLPTVSTRDRFGLTAATLCQYNGASECQPLDEPTPTLLGMNKMGLVECPLEDSDGHYEEVKAFLRKWGVIRQDEEAEVVIDGVRLRINDIGLRMLRPRELFTANGFPPDYIIDPVYKGKPLCITSQVRKCGNSVPPQFVKELFLANMDALEFQREQKILKKQYPLIEYGLSLMTKAEYHAR